MRPDECQEHTLDLPGMIRAAWEEGVQTSADAADLETLWRASNASCDAAFVEEARNARR